MSKRTGPEDVRGPSERAEHYLNMIVKNFDLMNAAEIRELAWVSKYQADKLLGAFGPNAVGRRITLTERL
jgi:hypothetical protein